MGLVVSVFSSGTSSRHVLCATVSIATGNSLTVALALPAK